MLIAKAHMWPSNPFSVSTPTSGVVVLCRTLMANLDRFSGDALGKILRGKIVDNHSLSKKVCVFCVFCLWFIRIDVVGRCRRQLFEGVDCIRVASSFVDFGRSKIRSRAWPLESRVLEWKSQTKQQWFLTWDFPHRFDLAFSLFALLILLQSMSLERSILSKAPTCTILKDIARNKNYNHTTMMANETMIDPVAEQRGNEDAEEEEVSDFVLILIFPLRFVPPSSSSHRHFDRNCVSILPSNISRELA